MICELVLYLGDTLGIILLLCKLAFSCQPTDNPATELQPTDPMAVVPSEGGPAYTSMIRHGSDEVQRQSAESDYMEMPSDEESSTDYQRPVPPIPGDPNTVTVDPVYIEII